MNITTTILTVGTALRHAQQAGATVEVLLGTSWISGQVSAVDGEGACMVTPDGGATVIRIASISAVRIEALAEPESPPERAPYDGFRFPKPTATDLGPIDFVKVAEACGAAGTFVDTDKAFEPALRKALDSGRPHVIHLQVDPAWVSPDRTPANSD